MATEQDALKDRSHAFDALRAAMVLLGIALHAACCYTSVPIPMVPYHDATTSSLFDWMCRFLHTFRLPTFFVMAGFFAALLTARSGPVGMLGNRWRRLMMPLLIGWPILAPLIILAVVFAWQRHPDFQSGKALSAAFNGQDERDGFLAHLWFLYDLFLFCLVATAGHFVLNRFLPNLPVLIAKVFRDALNRGTVLLAFPLATAVTLYPMHTGTFDTSAWLLPPIRILAAYGVFFGFGWLLFGERDRLGMFLKGAPRRTVAGCLLFLPHQAGLITLQSQPFQPGDDIHLVTVLSGSMACWWLIFGLTGLCLTHFTKPRPWIRYLTDASYWLYLAHLPLVLFLQGILAPLRVPAILKFSAVVSVATGLLILVYHYRVRNSHLGECLSGRRYPRGIVVGPE